MEKSFYQWIFSYVFALINTFDFQVKNRKKQENFIKNGKIVLSMDILLRFCPNKHIRLPGQK